MRHINIPVFIPHLGCPNQCIFCNQRFISGRQCFDESTVIKTIDEVLSTVSRDDICEIAFFGGSFTGIDRALMIRLLDLAQLYVNNKLVVGIRMSTRPDYISKEIVEILKKYTVTVVELGIQSMNDEILTFLKRGHSVSDTVSAAKLLRENGIPFVGQMMIGLPGATIEDEVECAKQICKLGAIGSRIYPTLVFKNTELESIYKEGLYSPLSIEEAIDRSARALDIFVKSDVECIRIGLCDSDNLHSDETYLAGPNEPSIGEMVKSRMYLNRIVEELDIKFDYSYSKLTIKCPKGLVSQIIGHKRYNVFKLKELFKFKDVKVVEDIGSAKINLMIKEEN